MIRDRAAALGLVGLQLACGACDADASLPGGAPSSAAPRPPTEASPPPTPSAAGAQASDDRPEQWRDPLAPSRPAWRSAGRPAPSWVRAQPRRELQYERSEAERGLLPCEAQDPGRGAMGAWQHLRPMGQIALPDAWRPDGAGTLDLLVHFHGQRPALKELVRSGEEIPLLALSLGIGAAYAPPFRDPSLFETLVRGAERVATAAVRDAGAAQVRRLALAGWSRGYDAIAEILAQPLGARVDALILLDGLHAPRDPAQQRAALAPFVALAERAARGEAFVFLSFSSIDTEGYASTTETAHAVIAAVGGVPEYVTRDDALGLELREVYSRGNLHVRGYAGNGRLDHCAQFGAYPDALRGLARFWRERSAPQ